MRAKNYYKQENYNMPTTSPAPISHHFFVALDCYPSSLPPPTFPVSLKRRNNPSTPKIFPTKASKAPPQRTTTYQESLLLLWIKGKISS